MIEVCLPANRFDKFRGTLEESMIYNITSFMLADARKSYRPVDNPHRIRLTQNTKVTLANPQPENFPCYAYDAKPFDVLALLTGDNTLLSDVIGVVHGLTGILPPKSGGDPRRQIYLKNESGTNATVTLWGDYAEEFNAESLSESSIEENMIVLFVGMAVTKFSGQLAFKNTASTRWYFNPEIPEVDEMRQNLGTQHYVIEWIGSGNTATEPTQTTLYALSNTEVDEIVRKKFRLNIVITEVDNPTDWWYYSCPSCWTKMAPSGNIRRCPKCRNTKKNQRYRISVKAEDMEPNPENKKVVGQFIFFGDNGAALTGKDAVLLAAHTKGRPD